MFHSNRSRVALLLCASAVAGGEALAQFSCIGFTAYDTSVFAPQNVGAPRSISVGDFNGNGKNEIMIASGPSGVSSDDQGIYILFGADIPLSLRHTTRVYTGNSTWAESADIDGDGELDIVFITSTQIGVMLGKGDGTFHPPQLQTWPGAVSMPMFALHDFGGGGSPDLGAISRISTTEGNLLLFRNDGAGFFESPVTPTMQAQSPFTVRVVELGPQGEPWMTLTSLVSGRFEAYRLDEHGSLDRVLDIEVQAPSQAHIDMNGESEFAQTGHVAADLNGNGLQDIAIAMMYDNDDNGVTTGPEGAVIVLLNNGDNTFSQQPTIYLSNLPWYIEAADLDGDGRPDLFTGSAPGGNVQLSVIRNTSSGGQFSHHGPVGIPMGGFPRMVLAADLGSGSLDILVANFWTDEVFELRNATPQGQPCVYDITGDGTVGASDLGVLLSRYGRPGQLADLNGDRVVDARDLSLLLSTWGMASESPRVPLQYVDWIEDFSRAAGDVGSKALSDEALEAFVAGRSARELAELLASGARPEIDADE